MRHLPTFVSVEPANFCQLQCPECPVGKRNTERLADKRQTVSLTAFRHILEQIKDYVHTIQFYFQGEPLLNQDLPEMIHLAHEAGLYTIVSTNALALTPQLAERLMQSGLSRIIVSIDGLSEQSYGSYRRGGSLRKALDGLRYLRQAKDTLGSHTHIALQSLLLRSNEHEWEAMKRQYRELGADSLTLKTAQFYDYENGNELMPSNERYARYAKGKDGKYHLKHRVGRSCRRLWTGCVITISGEILPCCYDKSSAYSFGNIFSTPLAEIWHGEKANRFRRTILQKRLRPEMCTNCMP
ncbi:MAG: SPASM domain-containing protein [Paludibacteraceae bacterium]|nr:SPASM domain-containing protein [Paludibacteraceae bacterium]